VRSIELHVAMFDIQPCCRTAAPSHQSTDDLVTPIDKGPHPVPCFAQLCPEIARRAIALLNVCSSLAATSVIQHV
jgi:hypothetical protein